MLPTKPRVYLYQNPADGSWAVDGIPEGRLDPELTLLEPSSGDVLADLGLPDEWAWLEAMAAAQRLSPRRIEMILGDESPTRFASGAQLRPQEWTFDTGGQLLTLFHLPLVIGVFEMVLPGPLGRVDECGAVLMEEPPADVSGAFIVGTARLYDSALAAAAWRGVTQGILTHVSAVLLRPPDAPLGAGEFVEAGLIHLPACPGARVVRFWEGEGEGQG